MDIIFRVNPIGESLDVLLRAPLQPDVNDECFPKIVKFAIQSYENYTEGYPSSPEYEKLVDDKFFAGQIDIPENMKRSGLYYLYILTNFMVETECCCNDQEMTRAVAVDMAPFYNLMVKEYKSLDCNDCADFSSRERILDLIWKQDLLTKAITLEDYPLSNDIWKKLLSFEFSKGDCMNSRYHHNKRSGNNRHIPCSTCH